MVRAGNNFEIHLPSGPVHFSFQLPIVCPVGVRNVNFLSTTVAPRYNASRYNEEPDYNKQYMKTQQNYSKIYGNKPRYKEIPAITKTVPTHNLSRYNKCFVLSLAVHKNSMMIQMVDI